MFHVFQHGTLIGQSASLWGAIGISQRYSTYSFADACLYDGISVVSYPDGEAIQAPQHARTSFIKTRHTKAQKKAMKVFLR